MIIQFDCKIFNPGSDTMRVHWDGWMRVRCVEDENESTLSDSLAPHMRSRICGGGPWLHREPPLTMSWLLVADKVQQFSSAVGCWRELIELKIVTFSASTISLWLVEVISWLGSWPLIGHGIHNHLCAVSWSSLSLENIFSVSQLKIFPLQWHTTK